MDPKIDLCKRAQTGDREAFGDLYDLYAKELYRYAYFVLGSPELAADAVQDAVISTFEQIKSLRKPEAFKAWIFKILSNTCNKYIGEKIIQDKMQAFDEELPLPEKLNRQAIVEGLESKGVMVKKKSYKGAVRRIAAAAAAFAVVLSGLSLYSYFRGGEPVKNDDSAAIDDSNNENVDNAKDILLNGIVDAKVSEKAEVESALSEDVAESVSSRKESNGVRAEHGEANAQVKSDDEAIISENEQSINTESLYFNPAKEASAKIGGKAESVTAKEWSKFFKIEALPYSLSYNLLYDLHSDSRIPIAGSVSYSRKGNPVFVLLSKTGYLMDVGISSPVYSQVNESKVLFANYGNTYFALFQYEGLYYTIEAQDASETEILKLVNTLIP